MSANPKDHGVVTADRLDNRSVTEIAELLLKTKGWEWLPGMWDVDGNVVLTAKHKKLPDLEHPATKGLIIARIRELKNTLHANPRWRLSIAPGLGRVWCWDGDSVYSDNEGALIGLTLLRALGSIQASEQFDKPLKLRFKKKARK